MAAKGAHELAVHSRFSVLANEDSDSSEEETTKGKDMVSLDAKKKAKNAKKRARKKKKAAEAGATSAEVGLFWMGLDFAFKMKLPIKNITLALHHP